eukprot:4435581-Pleurochrysis_carterae.AAC.3
MKRVLGLGARARYCVRKHNVPFHTSAREQMSIRIRAECVAQVFQPTRREITHAHPYVHVRMGKHNRLHRHTKHPY